MDLHLFFRGFLIGLSIAAPVGPIGVLCIRRTLSEGRIKGLLSGLGAASADMLYGAIAAFGLEIVTQTLVSMTQALKIAGGVFMIYLGIKTLREKPASQAAKASPGSNFSAFLSTFLLTLTNPMTIFSFLAIFAGTMLGSQTTSPVTIVAGVFFGSTAWWLFLSQGIGLFRSHINENFMVWINRIAGGIILAFGLAALLP